MKAMVSMEEPPVVGRGNRCGRDRHENGSDDGGQQKPLAPPPGRAYCARFVNSGAVEDTTPVMRELLAWGEPVENVFN
jgi:hypothetical protein